MSLYFTVRSRALASLVSALAQIVGTLLMGSFLDWTRFSVRARATAAYVGIMALIGACWAWGVVVQREYPARSPGLDWADAGFGRGWALYILWQTCWALTYNFGYWMIGSLAREAADVPRLTSYVRALESAGQTISSGISSTKTPVSRGSSSGGQNTADTCQSSSRHWASTLASGAWLSCRPTWLSARLVLTLSVSKRPRRDRRLNRRTPRRRR